MKKLDQRERHFTFATGELLLSTFDDKYMKKMHFSLKGLNYIQFKDILAKTSFNKKCPQLWKIQRTRDQ